MNSDLKEIKEHWGRAFTAERTASAKCLAAWRNSKEAAEAVVAWVKRGGQELGMEREAGPEHEGLRSLGKDFGYLLTVKRSH